MVTDTDDSHSTTSETDLERRTFLKAAGTAAIGAGLLSRSTTTARGAPKKEETGGGLVMGPGEFVVGGRHVVGTDGYDTIQAAWDAAEDGDTVYVHSSYDAEAVGEQFPIVLDFRVKEVLLTGGHPTGSVIDARHSPDTNVIEVIGRGHEDYRNNPLVQSLKIVGGKIGMRVRAAPYASFKDILFWMNGSHGVAVEELDSYGTFGVTFRNCVAWNCGGDGFRLTTSSGPHGTTFYGCHSLFNSGSGVQLRGYATRWHGGVIQNNGGYGVDARSGASQLVDNTYFEGNSTAKSTPIDIYASQSSRGFTVRGSYFQGGFFRDFDNGLSKGHWAVALGGAPHAEISHCSFTNYTGSFLYVRDAEDVDVHLASHHALDDTPVMENVRCTRLRSDGSLLPTDLTGGAEPGRFAGDQGVHDGSGDGAWGPAIWNGSRWVSVMDGSEL